MLTVTEFADRNGEISPDGGWVAYESNVSGQNEIYVHPFPEVDAGRWQVSTMGGTRPLWGPDGRELFYLTEAGVMGVTVEAGANFEASTPSLVVEGRYYGTQDAVGGRTYDISMDGQRFLMIKDETSADADAQIHVVVNWFTELERLVPTK